MSGHSKWSTIKRKKGANDAARAKIFTKLSREISVAVRESGADPNNNSRLRDLLAKGRSNNVPQDILLRAINKAKDNDKDNFEACVYEGYGAGGIAVIVECLTDNKNRTAGNVRHYFDKFKGNLGTTGCVSFMFFSKGIITIEIDNIDEEAFLEMSFESNAEDVLFDEGLIEITCAPSELSSTADFFEEKGYKLSMREVQKLPSTYTNIKDEETLKMLSLLFEYLEDDDDVQNVWHNLENPQDLD